MIGRAAINAEPFDLFPEHPLEQFDLASRVHAEIANEILPRLSLPITMPSSMNDEDVPFLHLNRRRLDHFGSDDGPVVHILRDIDHCAGTDQEIQGIGGHVAHTVGSVHGAVDVRADVERHVDPLRDDHLGLQVLRVIHLVAGVTDPTWRMHVHQMTEVDDLHGDCLIE